MRKAVTALCYCALTGLILAAAGAVWSLGGWGMEESHREYSRDQAALAVIASRLRERLQQAYGDGDLTDRELSGVFGGAVRSVRRAPGRTEVVARIAVTGYARCYRFTAVPDGAVSSAVLSACPTASAAVPVRGRVRHDARHALRAGLA